MNAPFNLERFVDAQAAVYEQVLTELRVGEKHTHWIWFIFPQMKGLGHSPQANHFGIGSLEEAVAYLRHPLLGPRLSQCTCLVMLVEGRTIVQILGSPDDMKFRSSMTLFAHAAAHAAIDPTDFNDALKKYFGGEPDFSTIDLLR
jgi:uncharacterized protein (DUF1810 family)